ncbi:hypothetical protein AAZX31_08G130500 [Glycine max]
MANGNDNTSTAITLLSKPTTTTDNTTLPFTDLEIPNHPPFSNNKKKPPLYQICKKKKTHSTEAKEPSFHLFFSFICSLFFRFFLFLIVAWVIFENGVSI